MANALRRVMLADIHAVGVPDCYVGEHAEGVSKGGVRISANTGRLHNEIMRNRLSLVPMPRCLSPEVMACCEVKIEMHAGSMNMGEQTRVDTNDTAPLARRRCRTETLPADDDAARGATSASSGAYRWHWYNAASHRWIAHTDKDSRTIDAQRHASSDVEVKLEGDVVYRIAMSRKATTPVYFDDDQTRYYWRLRSWCGAGAAADDAAAEESTTGWIEMDRAHPQFGAFEDPVVLAAGGSDKILLTRLQGREALEMSMYPSVSIPSNACNTKGYAGFGVASIATFMLSLDEKQVEQRRAEIVAAGPPAAPGHLTPQRAHFESHEKFLTCTKAGHYDFTIESIGIVPPGEIVTAAVRTLGKKVRRVLMMFKPQLWAEYYAAECPYLPGVLEPPPSSRASSAPPRMHMVVERKMTDDDRAVGESADFAAPAATTDVEVEYANPFGNTIWLRRRGGQQDDVHPLPSAGTVKMHDIYATQPLPSTATEAERRTRGTLTVTQGDAPVTSTNVRDSVQIAQFEDHRRYTFRIAHEDHTVGNLIQGCVYDRMQQQSPATKAAMNPIVFIGYRKPHPLKDFIELTVGVDEAVCAEQEEKGGDGASRADVAFVMQLMHGELEVLLRQIEKVDVTACAAI